MISLLELQWQLLQVDLKEGRSRLLRSAVLLGIAPVIALAALPVLFLGTAEILSASYGWPLAYTQFGLAGSLIVGALLIGWFGLRALISSMTTLTRSRSEFSENLAWMKSMLTREERREAAEHRMPGFGHRFN